MIPESRAPLIVLPYTCTTDAVPVTLVAVMPAFPDCEIVERRIVACMAVEVEPSMLIPSAPELLMVESCTSSFASVPVTRMPSACEFVIVEEPVT